MNVDELDERGARTAAWCFGPEGELPIGDLMLAQKIALEYNERGALALANRGNCGSRLASALSHEASLQSRTVHAVADAGSRRVPTSPE